MTLTTTIALDRLVDTPRLWRVMRELACASDGSPSIDTSDEDCEQLETPPAVGLLARLRLRCGVTAPLTISEEASIDAPVPPWGDSAWVVLSFDSTGNARDYHAWLVMEMFDWVSRSTAARMAWQNELDAGSWHFGTQGVSALGDYQYGAVVRQAVNGR